MNEVDLLHSLGQRAREEARPTIDVSKTVVRRLAQVRVRLVDRRLAAVLALACTLSILGLGVMLTRQTYRDPVTALLSDAYEGTGPSALLKVLEP